MEVAQVRAAMKHTNRRSQAGFSLVELLFVAVIIAILAAISLPGIWNYIKTYRLTGALSQVTTQLQAARSRAVMKNVNLGVVWAPTNEQIANFVVEDDLRPLSDPIWAAGANWGALSADEAQASTPLTLDRSVHFVNPNECDGGGAGNRWGIRFNRLGMACALPNTTCGVDPVDPPGDRFIYQDAAGTMFLCVESNTGLRRMISIAPGGRPRIVPGYK